jgi:thiol:disulfide interchange protein
MQRSAKLHLMTVAITLVGFCMLAIPLWLIRDTHYAGPLALGGLGLMSLGILSGLGFGPLGRARDRAYAAEDIAYRNSLEPTYPRQK